MHVTKIFSWNHFREDTAGLKNTRSLHISQYKYSVSRKWLSKYCTLKNWNVLNGFQIQTFSCIFKNKFLLSTIFVFLGCHKIVLCCPSLLVFWYAKRTGIAAWQIDVPKNDPLITLLNKVPGWTGNIDHMRSLQGKIVENKNWFVLLGQDFVFCRNLLPNFWGARWVE